MLAIMLFSGQWVTSSPAAEEVPPKSPIAATVRDLVDNPSSYDGRRVLVSGLIHSIKLEQGRRGSEYFVLVLAELNAPHRSNIEITVISDSVSGLRKDQRATIRGTFHREGNQHGHPYEYFIDAEAILRDNAA